MKLDQSQAPQKSVQFTKFRYFALIGSEHSQLQTLINKKQIQIDHFNTYQSYQEQFFARIIIPKVNETAFKLQIHISEYYKQLYPFQNAFIFITKHDIDSYQSNIRSQPLNVFKLVQLCIIMCFENIIISLEKNEYFAEYQAIESLLYEELKFLQLPKKSKVQYKIGQPFSIKELCKTRITRDIDYLKVNFLVLNIMDSQSAEIVILNGVLIRGQTVWLDGEKVCITKIVTFQKEVSFAFTNQIVICSIDKQFKMQKGSVGRYRGLCKTNIDVEMIGFKPAGEKPKVCRDILYQLTNWKKSITFEEGSQKCEMQILFNDNQHLLQFNRYPHLIIFSPMSCDVLAIGTLKLPKETKLPLFIMPKKFIETFTEESETNYFISKCRVCKVETINCILIPCGHLRYCQQCVTQQVCLYCESAIKQTVKIEIQEADPQKYKSLSRGYIDEDYLKHTNYQIVPPMIQFEISQQITNPNHFYKCQVCRSELFTHILIDEEKNIKYVCILCGEYANQSHYKIQY